MRHLFLVGIILCSLVALAFAGVVGGVRPVALLAAFAITLALLDIAFGGV